ncbi:membrane hypothetical protein [uncultured Defluviicoccus sp.]|uniref:TIR domain-containing protein n=1 Tax=metagenome TaxID=256318 RepID=A0A380TJU6_9ZZZZ|nr:membrane hypothetical protein [uncultured Defluviicoccus sp.]
MADIFVSYRSVDRPLANRVADALREKGVTVWFDRELQTGTTYREEIAREIAAASIVLLIWTADAARSPWVLDEAETARRRGALLTVVVGGAVMPRNLRGTVVSSIGDGATGPSASEVGLIHDAVADVLSSLGDAKIAAAQKRSRMIVRGVDILVTAAYFCGLLITIRIFDPGASQALDNVDATTIIFFPYILLFCSLFAHTFSRAFEHVAKRLLNLNFGPSRSRVFTRWVGEGIGYVCVVAFIYISAYSSQTGFFYVSPAERQEYPYLAVWLNPSFKFMGLFIFVMLITLPKYIPFFISRALRRRLLM